MLRSLFLKSLSLVPDSRRQWLRCHLSLAVPLSGLFRRGVPCGQPVIIIVRKGPNEGMRLAVDRLKPLYYLLEGHDEPQVIEKLKEVI
jgi:hypothetical protein